MGISLHSATPAEVTLVEETLDTVQVNDAQMMRLIADKAYDSAPLRKRLAEQNIEQITPHKRNRVKKKLQDGRPLRRYKRRWIIERTIRLARQLPSHRHPVRPLYQPIHHIRSHRLHHHHNEVHGLMKPLLVYPLHTNKKRAMTITIIARYTHSNRVLPKTRRRIPSRTSDKPETIPCRPLGQSVDFLASFDQL